ncbi:MAG: hypothetical protein MRZ79_27455 [Bacteroidia bacterium]|nr:hypothetical protein [Bacteroidia bacterium]
MSPCREFKSNDAYKVAIITGRAIEAQEVYGIGLVNEVIRKEQSLTKGLQVEAEKFLDSIYGVETMEGFK